MGRDYFSSCLLNLYNYCEKIVSFYNSQNVIFFLKSLESNTYLLLIPEKNIKWSFKFLQFLQNYFLTGFPNFPWLL